MVKYEVIYNTKSYPFEEIEVCRSHKIEAQEFSVLLTDAGDTFAMDAPIEIKRDGDLYFKGRIKRIQKTKDNKIILSGFDLKRSLKNQIVPECNAFGYAGNLVQDQLGHALSFDGVDDRVEVGDSDSLDVTSITLEAWVKINAYPTITQGLIAEIARKEEAYILQYDEEGHLRPHIYASGEYHQFETTTVLDLDKYYHVIMTYDEATEVLTLYINGDFDDSKTFTGAGAINASANILKIGSQGVAAHNGLIDAVRVYNRALSTTEVKEHYNGIFNDESGIKLLLRMDDGNGTETKDDSGNENNGTIEGAAWTSDMAPINLTTGTIQNGPEIAMQFGSKCPEAAFQRDRALDDLVLVTIIDFNMVLSIQK